MKILCLICFALLTHIEKFDNEEFDPYFFRNNFQDDIHENISFYKLFGLDNRIRGIGVEAYKHFNNCQYNGKNLGFVFNDLSNKYQFLDGMAFNGVIGLDKIDLSYRTHFIFNFKYNDSLSLGVVGMLAKSEWFYEESDSIAFNKLLEIDKYALLPINRNMKIYYKQIIELMKFDNSPRLKDRIENILKNYPGVAK